MISYKDITDDIGILVKDHMQLRKFITGPISEADIEKLGNDNYPFAYAECTNVSIDAGSMTFDIDLVVADIVLDDLSDRRDTYDNTLLMLKDLCIAILQSQYPNSLTAKINNRIDLQLPLECTPFTARFDNDLTGWQTSLSITTDNENNLCEAVYEP